MSDLGGYLVSIEQSTITILAATYPQLSLSINTDSVAGEWVALFKEFVQIRPAVLRSVSGSYIEDDTLAVGLHTDTNWPYSGTMAQTFCHHPHDHMEDTWRFPSSRHCGPITVSWARCGLENVYLFRPHLLSLGQIGPRTWIWFEEIVHGGQDMSRCYESDTGYRIITAELVLGRPYCFPVASSDRRKDPMSS